MSKIEKINACNAAFQEALREGDGDRCSSLCDENAVLMPPNAQPIKGRDAIKQHFANLGADNSVTGEVVQIEVSGDLAYQVSHVTWDSSGKTKYTESLDVLKQQHDGSWLIVASAWNSSEGFEQEWRQKRNNIHKTRHCRELQLTIQPDR